MPSAMPSEKRAHSNLVLFFPHDAGYQALMDGDGYRALVDGERAWYFFCRQTIHQRTDQ